MPESNTENSVTGEIKETDSSVSESDTGTSGRRVKMKCIFVGDLEDDAGFVAEVLQEKGIELIEAGVYDPRLKRQSIQSLRHKLRLLFMIY